MSAEDRGASLEKSDGIAIAHDESAHEGQTEAPALEANVDLHFIAFTACDGSLYELDGCKAGPINHGPTTADTFLGDATKVCQQFIERGKGNLNFTMVALCKAQ